MPERGGPATQSGILYQNSIAALYMGQMCDATRRPDDERVIEVRLEAPEHVDDTVVVFADDHRDYIQAKESLTRGSDAWDKLWVDFGAQFRDRGFRPDRDHLVLWVGENSGTIRDLQEASRRTNGCQSVSEWWGRLNESQRSLVREIRPLFVLEPPTDERLLVLFSTILVEIWPLKQIEQQTRALLHAAKRSVARDRVSPVARSDRRSRPRPWFVLDRDCSSGVNLQLTSASLSLPKSMKYALP